MDLSIIIVNWNVRDLLRRCLESIFLQTKNISFEVFVVDNNSSDGSLDMLKNMRSNLDALRSPDALVGAKEGGSTSLIDKLHLIMNEENVGFAKANNQALREAKGELVLFLNPDTELRSGLDKLLALMRLRPDVAALTCKLVNPDGTLQRNVKRHPTFWSQVLIMLKLHHFSSWCQSIKHYLAHDFNYSREQEVEQVMGAFFLTRRKLINELKGWDEDYPLWWEDVQLCQDFARRGWKIIYTPTYEVLHHEGKSFAQVMHLSRQRRFNRGMIIYFRKNGKWWQVKILQILSPMSLILASLTQLLKIKPRSQSKI